MFICRILTNLVAKVENYFELNKFSGEKMQNGIDDDGGNPACKDVDDVVGAEIDRGEIHQDKSHHRQRGKPLAACAP